MCTSIYTDQSNQLLHAQQPFDWCASLVPRLSPHASDGKLTSQLLFYQLEYQCCRHGHWVMVFLLGLLYETVAD